MLIYIGGLLSTLLLLYLSNKCNNKKGKLALEWFSVVPFFIISAIRYDVGTDFLWRYTADFENIANGIDVKNFELGFKLLIKLCLLFSKDVQLMFIITSLIVNVLIIWAIIKNSKNVYLSLVVYFCGGFFFLSMNAIRQFIAMSLVLYSYKYIFEKKNIIFFVLSVLLAFFIHSSSLIMIILVAMDKRKLLKPWLTIPISIIILIFGSYFFDFLGTIMSSTRFSVYFVGKYAKGDISWVFVLYNLIIYAFISWGISVNKTKNKEIEKEDSFYYNMQTLALITTCMGSIHVLFSRIASYFMVFQIISIPYYIEKIKYGKIMFNNKAVNDKIFNKRNLCLIIVISYILLLVYTNVLNNDNEVLPYRVFINKSFYIK